MLDCLFSLALIRTLYPIQSSLNRFSMENSSASVGEMVGKGSASSVGLGFFVPFGMLLEVIAEIR